MRRQLLESELDQGHGACWLRHPGIASLVEGALLHFHGQRYELRAWVVMRNHVHVLLRVSDIPLAKTIEGWKSFTAHAANKLLKRNGKFWADDYFDIYIRDAAHEKRVIRYIEQNPCKAKLVLDPKEWPRSSSRLRDQYGQLQISTPSRTEPVPNAAATTNPVV